MKQIVLPHTDEAILLTMSEDSEVKGLYVLHGNESIKIKSEFIHQKSGVHALITIKAVVFDSAYFDCEGLLRIEKGAKGVDTYLRIHCILIGPSARARIVPSLEIREDEIKAGHGATVGHLDDQELYYLQSHGLSQSQSQDLLIQSFLSS